MKIVDRTTFMEMPSGTVYAKYAPCFFQEWSIKGDTLRRDDDTAFDWFYQSIDTPHFTTAHDSGAWSDQLDLIEAGESSPPLTYDVEGRDGCFDDDQLFAVYEAADVKLLIKRLNEAVALVEQAA